MTAILTTKNLSKEFGGFKAVNDVSLEIKKGDIHALIGPNGAGKTTFFNLLTRFLPATAGEIIFNGRNVSSRCSATLAKDGLVRSFQVSAIFPNLTLLENVRIALQRKTKISLHFWRSLSQLNKLDDEAYALLELVNLEQHAHSLAANLPYGLKRALELVTTLAMQPDLMLLDEPTQGMGHEDVEKVTALIKKVAQGRTVLMVEHNMQVVSSIADSITVLARGAVLAEGSYQEVASNRLVMEAYMGSSAAVGGA